MTTLDAAKRLYVDPRMLDVLAGRRVALVDDVFSSGTSILAALRLLAIIGIEPDAIGTAMLLSERWHEPLTGYGPHWLDRVRGVFRTPLLKHNGDG